MDKSAIGKIGVATVTTYLIEGGYLDPHINSDDTIAMWDGNIFVYKSKDDFSNKNFKYQIPVQVKAEEFKKAKFPNATSHAVPVVDLKNYHSDGGVVFFKVLFMGDRKQIYVSFLTKERIENLLSEISNDTQLTKTIVLDKAPEDRKILLEKLGRIYLHRNHERIDLSQLGNRLDYKIHVTAKTGKNNFDLFAYLATHSVDMMVSMDNLPGEFIVRNGPVRVMVTAQVPSKISINGNVYYNKYTREYTPEGLLIRIGNSCTLKISYDSNPFNITVNLTIQANSISEIVNDAKFILEIVEYKYIQFNDFKFQLTGLKGYEEALKEWNGQLRFWTDVQYVFKMLHIPQTLRIKELSEGDYKNLDTLTKAFVYNKHVYGNISNDTLHLFEIQDLKIAVLAKKIKNGGFQLVNVYDLMFSIKDESGEHHIIPTESALLGFNKLPSNLKVDNLYKEYRKLARSDKKVLLQANIDLLQLLNHYDRCNDADTIKTAYRMAQWLKKDGNGVINEKISLLNYLQTAKRKNKTLKKSEIKLLENISPSNDLDRFAINALLGNIEEARKYFDQLNDTDKDLYKGLPIVHFINDEKS